MPQSRPNSRGFLVVCVHGTLYTKRPGVSRACQFYLPGSSLLYLDETLIALTNRQMETTALQGKRAIQHR